MQPGYAAMEPAKGAAGMVEVTSVERIRSRFRIQLDNGERYELSQNLYRERPLEPGEQIDEKEFSQWVTLHQYKPALERAVAMLAARACSKGEICRKLKIAGYSDETVEMVLYKLEKHELLNDQEFAEQWARYRSGQKYGPRRIAEELRRKGVSADETEAALNRMPEDEQYDQALYLALKGLARRQPEEDLWKAKQRIAAGIVRRGYDWDTAKDACEQAAQELHLAEN